MSERKVFESFERVGNCMICQKEKDLRLGACFDCSDKVGGKKIPKGHKLWEKANPDNVWYVGEL